MKFCTKCGAKLVDESAFCPKCGCAADLSFLHTSKKKKRKNISGVTLAANICMSIDVILKAIEFILISCFALEVVHFFDSFFGGTQSDAWGWWLLVVLLGSIPLLWSLLMGSIYFKKTLNGKTVSIVFKICCLLSVNIIAGILMLCDNNN